MARPIPTWKDRLRACFRWRHRLLHVFGVPAAVGATVAVATATALNPDVGLSLGALTAAVGTALAGYYVTAGFDRTLVENLSAEVEAREADQLKLEQDRLIRTADPAVQDVLMRIVHCYESIEAVFLDGIDDPVESVLQNSRGDLRELRDRAFKMVVLFQKLGRVIDQFNPSALEREQERVEKKLRKNPQGKVREALLASQQASERALSQWRAAVDKREQVRSVLTVIETNLHEFKLAMELRKADAVMGEHGKAPDVSELQARLAATGQACDDLMGRNERVRRVLA